MKLIISKFFSQYTLLALTLGLILFPEANVLAQNFVPLVGIPGVGTSTQDIGSYMNAIYRLSITLAALLAVLILIRAGIKYMFSEIVTSKEDAKKDIKGALLGLLLIISAVLILSTINEDLTNFNIVITPLESPPSQQELRAQYCKDQNNCTVFECSSSDCIELCSDNGGNRVEDKCYIDDNALNSCDIQTNRQCCQIKGMGIIHSDNDGFICKNEDIDLIPCLTRSECPFRVDDCESSGGSVLTQTNTYIICDKQTEKNVSESIAENCQSGESCGSLNYDELQRITGCTTGFNRCTNACEDKKGVFDSSLDICITPIPLTGEITQCDSEGAVTCADAQNYCENDWGFEFQNNDTGFTCTAPPKFAPPDIDQVSDLRANIESRIIEEAIEDADEVPLTQENSDILLPLMNEIGVSLVDDLVIVYSLPSNSSRANMRTLMEEMCRRSSSVYFVTQTPNGSFTGCRR